MLMMCLFGLMMMFSSAFSFIALVCLGWTDAAPDGVFTHQIASNIFAQSKTGIAALTPAPTALPNIRSTSLKCYANAPAVTTIDPPNTDPTSPALERIGSTPDAAADLQDPAYARPRAARQLVQRRSLSVSDKTQVRPDLISTSDNSQELVCNCSTEGVLEPDECNRDTGQCVCVTGYTGLQCEECEEDHFSNGTIGCLPCGCDSFGASGPGCDSSGMCVCKTGVYGPKCDDCHPGFFHFSSSGCQPCQCNRHSTYCHPQSGLCMDCQDNTQGPNCEECVPRFYRALGSDVTDACEPCPCPEHSSSGTCHLDSGGRPVCDECKPGFEGSTCGRCADGFYKLGEECAACECNRNADPKSAPQICNPENGRCLLCANHTAGAHCERCAAGYTGNALTHNCTLKAPSSPRMSIATRLQTSTFPPSSSLLFTYSPPSIRPSEAPPLQSDQGDRAASNSTASALAVVSWTQFNVIVLAVIIALLVLLMGFVGAVYTFREYRNRKLNAPFWTIELKEDNISFSSYHDSLPHAEPGGLLEEEQCAAPANGQLALAAASGAYKA